MTEVLPVAQTAQPAEGHGKHVPRPRHIRHTQCAVEPTERER